MTDPRLCHTTALRLGAATPDNKHGKEETANTLGPGDKLIPVKEEEGVERSAGLQHVVSEGGDWCEGVMPGDMSHHYMGDSCPVRLTAGTDPSAVSCVPNTSCSVFSLSECVVGVAGLQCHPTTLSSSSALPVTVTEVLVTVLVCTAALYCSTAVTVLVCTAALQQLTFLPSEVVAVDCI